MAASALARTLFIAEIVNKFAERDICKRHGRLKRNSRRIAIRLCGRTPTLLTAGVAEMRIHSCDRTQYEKQHGVGGNPQNERNKTVHKDCADTQECGQCGSAG